MTSTVEPPVGARSPAEGLSIQLIAAGPGGPVQWRLVGSDERIVGHGVGDHLDDAGCCVAVRVLQGDVTALPRRLYRNAAGAWVWELDRRGVVVATAGRSYEQRERCELAMMVFVLNFADAVIDPHTRSAA